MVKIVCFGHRVGEDAKIFSSVEYAFDVYRKKLASFMQTVDEVVQSVNRIDEFTDKYVAVHDEMRLSLKQVPECWEQNERILRNLSCPAKIEFVYAILPGMNSQVESVDDQPSPEDRPGAQSASYDSLEQVLIHLDRDWGRGGQQLRAALYKEGILATLAEVGGPAPLDVLVPGGGLGRLAAELASAGHR